MRSGFKSTLLDNTLTFNVAAFYARIKDYQQGVRIVDQYTTDQNLASGIPINGQTAYTTATGNVPQA